MRSRRSRSRRNREVEEPTGEPPVERMREPEVEQLLAERFQASELGEAPSRIGVLTVGRGQLARRLALRWPEAQVDGWLLDSYQTKLAVEADEIPPNLNLVCAADWPGERYDLICAPIRRRELAELNRDLLQSAYQRLRVGGELFIGVDSQDHPALLAEIREWARPVECSRDERGSLFHLRKSEELKRTREFRSEVVFRDRENLLRLVTRPGVFAHRQLDAGARQILKALDEIRERKIMDLGCGSGAIAIALAARNPEFEVWAVDSHARAVEATQLAAQVNGVHNLTAVLSHDAAVPGAGTFGLVTANPPYFANFEIARRFLEGAVRALQPGGECLLVTKLPEWYREHASEWLQDIEIWPSGHYHLVRGVRWLPRWRPIRRVDGPG